MVFYIIACHKDGTSEDNIEKVLNTQVMKENNRSIGEIYPLTKSVSSINLFWLFRLTKLNSRGWDFFDLKKFDGLNRDGTKSEPAIVEGETSSLFYKICQPDWNLAANDFTRSTKQAAVTEVPESCAMSEDAFLMVDGECKYTFNNGAVFTGIEDE